MRPQKIIIRAFGPYAGEQIIDFTQLRGRNLFLITGPTGSGKTTIFDAICYALYGKASGLDRDGENLRSHFAAPDLLTSVELEFELKGKNYYVRRVPRQLRPRVRGDGFTEQNAEAELRKLDDGCSIITGVRQVDEEITKILGLNYQQFRQIVMIPQGEFRELLTADSSEREDILQKIFGTEIFRLIQQKLNDREKALRTEIRDLESQRKGKIQNLDATTDLVLAQLLAAENWNVAAIIEQAQKAISKDQELLADCSGQINEQEKLVTAKQQEIFTAEENNRKLVERDKAEQRKKELESLKSYYLRQEEILEKARKALTLKGMEEYYIGNVQIHAKRQTEFEEAVRQEKQAAADLEQAQKDLQAEQQNDSERQRLNEELIRLKGLTVKIDEYQNAQKLLLAAEQNWKKTITEKNNLQKELGEIKQQLTNTQEDLELSLLAAQTYLQKCTQKDKLSRVLEKVKDFKTESETLQKLSTLLLEQQESFAEQKELLERKQADLEQAQRIYFQSLAGILAENLRGGEACPVCGSLSHPQPAQKAGGVLSEQELKDMEQELRQSHQVYEQRKSALDKTSADYLNQQRLVKKIRSELEPALQESVGEDTIITEDCRQLTAFMRQLQTELNDLDLELQDLDKSRLKESILRQKIKETTEKHAQLEKSLERLSDTEKDCYSKVCSLQEVILRLEQEIPPTIRTSRALEEEIEATNKKYETLKLAWERAQSREQECKQKQASAVTFKASAHKSLNEAEQEMVKAAELFATARKQAGFDTIEEYRQAKRSEQEIKDSDQQIRDYQKDLEAAVHYFETISQEVKGLSKRDLAILNEELAGLQEQKNKLAAAKTAVASRLNHNKNLLSGILQLGQQIGQKEQQYMVVGDLAKVAKGDNSQRLSFERYVLAAFFNDIIAAANIRFQKMTYGRYRMNRIADKGKGLAQSGLEIEVFDYFTGRARHIKTLSGGESFKASLALALGLADVVQSYAGGVSLDTMFIDEGFGTLDPESLDSSINCLCELQQTGRLVGIISHVPELKASIEAKLEVIPAKDGSVASFSIDF